MISQAFLIDVLFYSCQDFREVPTTKVILWPFLASGLESDFYFSVVAFVWVRFLTSLKKRPGMVAFEYIEVCELRIGLGQFWYHI